MYSEWRSALAWCHLSGSQTLSLQRHCDSRGQLCAAKDTTPFSSDQDGTYTLGRSVPAELVIGVPTVSAKHAELKVRECLFPLLLPCSGRSSDTHPHTSPCSVGRAPDHLTNPQWPPMGRT